MAPPEEYMQVQVDRKRFDAYVGNYQPEFHHHHYAGEDDHLFEQATGQSAFEIFPEGDHYFLKVVDAQITFVTDSNGRTTCPFWGSKDLHLLTTNCISNRTCEQESRNAEGSICFQRVSIA